METITSGLAARMVSSGAVTSVTRGEISSAATIWAPSAVATAFKVAEFATPYSSSCAITAMRLPFSSLTANSANVAPTVRWVPAKAPNT